MSLRLEGRVVFFATDNVHKFNEARRVLGAHRIATGMLRVKGIEIQSSSLDEIARASVIDAFRKCHLPTIVEDAGLFVHALNGFPGPYAAYVYRTIGNEGLLRIMEGINDRSAKFESAVAYFSAESKLPTIFKGEVLGEITMALKSARTASGFGFDPIFKPMNSAKTFAEMTVEEKNRLSHRSHALQQFADWYKQLPFPESS